MKVRAMFREIFLEMGFEQMATQQFVESSFWNFDALFQPQQHPARDAHDTFFLKCDPPRRTFHLRRIALNPGSSLAACAQNALIGPSNP